MLSVQDTVTHMKDKPTGSEDEQGSEAECTKSVRVSNFLGVLTCDTMWRFLRGDPPIQSELKPKLADER